METYNETQIGEKLKTLSGWSFKDNAIEREYNMKSFNEALGFMVRIGLFAEQMDHHPDIFNVYNQLKIRIYTHSVNGITKLDFDLATKIESAYKGYELKE
jgi:4a-hydroxytetrahydrobiopterin dehydratase